MVIQLLQLYIIQWDEEKMVMVRWKQMGRKLLLFVMSPALVTIVGIPV
jgi:uncharacterized membrane protein